MVPAIEQLVVCREFPAVVGKLNLLFCETDILPEFFQVGFLISLAHADCLRALGRCAHSTTKILWQSLTKITKLVLGSNYPDWS